jgi:hypothetical protein
MQELSKFNIGISVIENNPSGPFLPSTKVENIYYNTFLSKHFYVWQILLPFN